MFELKSKPKSAFKNTVYFSQEIKEAEIKAQEDGLKSADKAFPKESRTPANEAAYKLNYKMTCNVSFEQNFQPFNLLLKSFRKFYQTGYSEVTKRFYLKDEFYEFSSLVQPKNARKLNPASLAEVFKRFPQLKESCDPNLAYSEWRKHASLPLSHFGVTDPYALYNMKVDDYWKAVLSTLNPCGEPVFPNLTECMYLLLCLPFSNASAETVFSHLKEVKDDKQNRQETPTTDAILKAKFWMLNEEKSASKIQFPKELVILAKNVKSNAPILHE
jgi:hypothetical protein